eukprot:6683367-Alexandrium_andersonii.AAC.1
MSASLVGSEMCIRDRSTARAAELGRRATSCPAATQVPSPPSRVLRPPVSYTHLTLPTICSV